MVGAGHPEGVLARHAGAPHQDVLYGVVEHVAHVQHTRDVGRRDDYRVRFPVVRYGVEQVMLHPVFIPSSLHCMGVIFRCKFFHAAKLRKKAESWELRAERFGGAGLSALSFCAVDVAVDSFDDVGGEGRVEVLGGHEAEREPFAVLAVGWLEIGDIGPEVQAVALVEGDASRRHIVASGRLHLEHHWRRCAVDEGFQNPAADTPAAHVVGDGEVLSVAECAEVPVCQYAGRPAVQTHQQGVEGTLVQCVVPLGGVRASFLCREGGVKQALHKRILGALGVYFSKYKLHKINNVLAVGQTEVFPLRLSPIFRSALRRARPRH